MTRNRLSQGRKTTKWKESEGKDLNRGLEMFVFWGKSIKKKKRIGIQIKNEKRES